MRIGAGLYHWRELPQVSFLSRQNTSFVARSILLSRKKHVNTSKSSFKRPLSFILLSHSQNQSESTTKFYNSSKADAGGHVLTLTWCVLRYDRAESFWMPTDTVKFPVHSLRLLGKKLLHLSGRCYYKCCCFSPRGEPGGGYSLLRSKCARSAYMCVWGGGGMGGM